VQRIVQEVTNFTTAVTVYTILLLFVINSSDIFEHNCVIHTINTRNRTDLHLPHLREQYKKVPTILALRFAMIFPPI